MISAAPLFLPDHYRLLLSEMSDHKIAKLPSYSAPRMVACEGPLLPQRRWAWL
jgi:hypothetical protein